MGLFDDDGLELDELFDSVQKYPSYTRTLKDVHSRKNLTTSSPSAANSSTMDDLATTCKGELWSHDNDILLKFLYLGCNEEAAIIKPFNQFSN